MVPSTVNGWRSEHYSYFASGIGYNNNRTDDGEMDPKKNLLCSSAAATINIIRVPDEKLACRSCCLSACHFFPDLNANFPFSYFGFL